MLALAVTEAPVAVAVTMAVWDVLDTGATAVNWAVLEAAGTVIVAGMEISGGLLERDTPIPPTGAALDKETVQVIGSWLCTIAGVQTIFESSEVDVTEITADLLELPKVAVSVSDCVPAEFEAVAVNWPVVDPAAMVTVAGTDTETDVLDIETEAPAAPAADDSDTEHIEDAPAEMVCGAHVKPVICGGGVRSVSEVETVDVPSVAVTFAISFATVGAEVADA